MQLACFQLALRRRGKHLTSYVHHAYLNLGLYGLKILRLFIGVQGCVSLWAPPPSGSLGWVGERGGRGCSGHRGLGKVPSDTCSSLALAQAAAARIIPWTLRGGNCAWALDWKKRLLSSPKSPHLPPGGDSSWNPIPSSCAGSRRGPKWGGRGRS